MAEESENKKQPGNINMNVNYAQAGLNMDQTLNQIKPGVLTYALNASLENFDASSTNYQNEQGNELCVTFPKNFVLIGKYYIQEINRHIFFITNPSTGDSEIGYMDNNDCKYYTKVSGKCLNFNINNPIHKVVHRITNCSIEIYWTDGLNPRRYMDIENPPYILNPSSTLCDPTDSPDLDCNQLKLQPNFSIPQLSIVDVISGGGDLTAGTYQFAIQYSDASSNSYTSYYSVTNPTPIANPQFITPNFNYQVGKSILVNIKDLDITGQYQYFNLAVIKTVNNIPSVELVGTYFIDSPSTTITYTGQNKTQIRLTINDIFEKFPYYEIAQDVTAAQDVLIWDNLTSIDRVNYQSIASQIKLEWESWRLPPSESYADELNATNLRGYLRDEVYAFEIVFLLKNGKQTDGFHIPGREKNNNENYPDVPDTNEDFIGEPDPGTNTSPYWKIYNTASVTGFSSGYSPSMTYKGPYQYGDFAYWESEDVYPCNIEVWGDLVDQPIRHHKFPDVLVSPHYESALLIGGNSSLVMQNDAVFPLGVKINTGQVLSLVNNSNLTTDEKADIIGYKIVRGDRGTNKSIIAKGILRNVGEYKRQEQSFYFPNYPYNDLTPDPFINENNNAWSKDSVPFLVGWIKNDVVDGVDVGYAEYEYTDINSGKLTKGKIYSNSGPQGNGILEFCSITRPISKGNGIVRVGPANYDVYEIYSDSGIFTCGHRAGWQDPFNDINVNGTIFREKWIYNLGFLADGAGYTVVVTEGSPSPQTTKCGTINLVLGTIKCCEPRTKLRPNKVFALGEVETPPGLVLGASTSNRFYSRRSSLNCAEETPLKGIDETNNHLQVFNSPETSFGQPFLGTVLKLENVMFGAGTSHFVEVKKNAKYKLLTKEAQEDALRSSNRIGNITDPFNATAMFTAYQSYLTIYVNGITRKNYAYSYNSIANYDYCESIPNDLGIKQRPIDYSQYIIPSVQSVGDPSGVVMNNWRRETSVFIKTIEDRNSLPVKGFDFPSNSVNMVPLGITDVSRKTISSSDMCATPEKQTPISVVSYYASMKNIFVNQWGQIYSYNTVDTGFQRTINSNATETIFGGDTFISRFTFKTKVPFFFDNRVGAPDDSDIFYDEIGNLGYPKYWHSARSVLSNYQVNSNTSPVITNIISYKAHNFDCPSNPDSYPPIDTGSVLGVTGLSGTYRTFYDGYFYLFAYGVPNFYCETSYNLDLRQAYDDRVGDFWPRVTSGIPDDWVQESYVAIANDNTYTYNVTFSKQNKENTFTHLPADWNEDLCRTNYPFRAIYSDSQQQDADNRVNNWLTYRALSYFDFPQNYGPLTSLDGIQNKAVLARFENKSLLYNNLLTVDTSNPQAAYFGNPTLFKGAPPIDFAETDLGYVGSQNKFLLKIPQGQITVDAKRGQVFLISGIEVLDLTGYGSGVQRFFTDHLAFEILRYFPEINIDNHFNGIGLHGVYDTKFDRVIITKLDYIPLTKDIKYDSSLNEFYIESTLNDTVYRTQIYLDDVDFFCNKSWTISYNMNTKSWISFHSYIPNFYIGENNFYYSGLNNCCSDTTVDFQLLAGVMEYRKTSTTTTTIFEPITTTTTTIAIDCTLIGNIIETQCELEGNAVITVAPPTTTTICFRPSGLTSNVFVEGYQVNGDPVVISSGSYNDACNGLLASRFENTTVQTFTIQSSGLNLFDILYYDSDNLDCTLVPTGWYFTAESQFDGFVYHVENGYITEIVSCECEITTTTTTTIVTIDCCNLLIVENDKIYVVTIDDMIIELNVPGYTSSIGVTMTPNFLWSINTTIEQWDITLSPFSATYNKSITLPVGFTTNSGIVALNNENIISIDNSSSPEVVTELYIEDLLIAVPTIKFNLEIDRVAVGNMLYSADGKLIVMGQDSVTGDYYISQYDYVTGNLEMDVNVGTIVLKFIHECDCNIYVIDSNGTNYILNKLYPYGLIETLTSLVPIPDNIIQSNTCMASSLMETTTTTTTIAPTTTTTTTL